MTKVQPTKQAAYEQAVSFRKRGFTYSEIAKICNVSRGTVSNWLKNEPFSQTVAKDNAKKAIKDNKQRLLLINKARVAERRSQYDAAIKTAETEFKHYKHNPLFIAGLSIYMSVGDMKNTRTIRISNQNTQLHSIFIMFAKEFLAVEKANIRFWLLLYPELNEIACMKHWCKKTGLSPAQFHKNQVIQSSLRGETLHFGVGNTIIGSTLLKKKLQHWISLLVKEIKIK